MSSSQLAAVARISLREAEQRRHYRVPVALLGRYMLADHREFACQTIDMSPGGVAIVAPVKGAVGERVVLYLEHIGRIEGEITRQIPEGFALSISATPRKRDKIASQLTWLANRHELGLPEDRRHERIVPRNGTVEMKVEGGRTKTAHLIDVSMSGCAIAMEPPLPIGTALLLGRTPAKVVRHFQGGVAVEFLLPVSPDRFDENIVL